jgi:outer membrane biosynthesis protein TonB
MGNSAFAQIISGALGLTALASAPLTFAVAHQDHEAKCNETSINAMNADIQAMEDGEAKTTAMKESEMAKAMLAKKDTDACMDHMHKAMEAMEQ